MERRGRIDTIANLTELDLVEFNGGVNPYRNEFIRGAFRQGAPHYRAQLGKWGFVGRGRVADVGSGYGRWSVFLAEVNDGVVGFERNPDANALAAKIATHFGLNNVRFETADVAALPAPDASFDAVWCFNTLHFVDRAKALSEMNRILKTGGLLHLGGYNGAGNMLVRIFNNYPSGGASNHLVKFGLEALARGPQFDGPGNYASAEHMAEVLARFGFALCETPALDADPVEPFPDGRYGQLLRDLTRLARKLKRNPEALADFARHTEFAKTHPVNISLVATKTGTPSLA